MLTRKVFAADGPPPESESEHFAERFAKDLNRTLSGQPIFGGADGEGVEVIPARFPRPWGRPSPPGRPRPKTDSDGGGDKNPPTGSAPPGGRNQPRPDRKPPRKRKRHDHESRESPHEKEKYPIIVDRPAFIHRYPDGRLYLSVRPDGRIGTRSDPGSVAPSQLRDKAMVDALRFSVSKTPRIDYPRLSDQRTFEQRRAAGKESYVRGEVLNEHGVPIAATILIDPESGKPLRAPVGEDITLTADEIKKLGLTRWHQPHRRSR